MTSVGGLPPVGWGYSATDRVEAGAAAIGRLGAGRETAGEVVPGEDEGAGKPLPVSFGKLLGQALEGLAAAEERADLLTARLASGEPVELHEVIIATEKAQLAFDLAVQLRNRVVEAYQEIMRMPV